MTFVNDSTPDSDLLREVAVNHVHEPFRLLVSRYADLVYSSAARQIHDSNLLDDVTQAVFLLLWQRAGTLQSNTRLSGWLLVATRNVASNLLRQEERLKRRERKVAMTKSERDPSKPADAGATLPLLDEAIAQLGTTDRDAIVERFFNSSSHREVAAKLGLSEEAATKRVSRGAEEIAAAVGTQGRDRQRCNVVELVVHRRIETRCADSAGGKHSLDHPRRCIITSSRCSCERRKRIWQGNRRRRCSWARALPHSS